jgi:hypothetical protein
MRPVFRFFLFPLLLGGAFATTARAQQRVEVHGYLTQAYAGSSDVGYSGIPTEGTADYRSGALLIRYSATGVDQFVFQLSHRRMGRSSLQSLERQVEVDWAFYQRRVFGATVRAGRLPMARGLFNEVRHVGPVLPFFRAARSFYPAGMDEVDGAAVSRNFGIGGGWSVDANAYGGRMPIVLETMTTEGPRAVDLEGRGTYGTQFWINTPIWGVKAGFGTMRTRMVGDEGGRGRIHSARYSSFDATFERFYLRAEAAWVRLGDVSDNFSWYGHGGVRLTDKVTLSGQYEHSNRTVRSGQLDGLEYQPVHDFGVGLAYAITPRFVVKSESHIFKGYDVDQFVPFSGPAIRNRYFIASVSMAF